MAALSSRIAMNPISRTIPSPPPRISSRPPILDQVSPLVRNSASAAAGPRQLVASLPSQIALSSEPSSLIELRCGPLAGQREEDRAVAVSFAQQLRAVYEP